IGCPDTGRIVIANAERLDDADAEAALDHGAGLDRGEYIAAQIAGDAKLLEGCVDQVTHPAVMHEGDELLIAQVFGADQVAARKAVIFWHDADGAGMHQWFDTERAVWHAQQREPH